MEQSIQHIEGAHISEVICLQLLLILIPKRKNNSSMAQCNHDAYTTQPLAEVYFS